MSKVAKKRIAALVLIVVFVLLTMSLKPEAKIVGKWASVGSEEQFTMNFASDDTVVVTFNDSTSEPMPYAFNEEQLSITLGDVSSMPAAIAQSADKGVVETKLPAAVCRMIINGTKVEKKSFFVSPIIIFFLLIVIVFTVLWCFEEDINTVINAYLARFGKKKKKKLSKDDKRMLKAKAKREREANEASK